MPGNGELDQAQESSGLLKFSLALRGSNDFCPFCPSGWNFPSLQVGFGSTRCPFAGSGRQDTLCALAFWAKPSKPRRGRGSSLGVLGSTRREDLEPPAPQLHHGL